MKSIIFTIVAIIIATMVFCQEFSIEKNSTASFFGNVVEDFDGNLYVVEEARFVDPTLSHYDSIVPYLWKLDIKQEKFEKRKISIENFSTFFYTNPPSKTTSFLSSKLIVANFNKNENLIELIGTGVNGNPDTSYNLKTFHLKFDTYLNKIEENIILTDRDYKFIEGKFFKDSLFFGVYFSTITKNMYMTKLNLQNGNSISIRDLLNFAPHVYSVTGVLPINNKECIYSLGSGLYKTDFKDIKTKYINDCFSCWPQLINPVSPHYFNSDSTFVIFGSNVDSVNIFNGKNSSINFNEYDISGYKTNYKPYNGKFKYQNIAALNSITFLNNDFYIISNNADTTDFDKIEFLNYYTTPGFIKLIKISKNGEFIYEKLFDSQGYISPITQGINVISNNRLIMIHDEWDHISHPNMFVKDIVFTILNEDGEILSTNKQRVSENHNFLVYPNPANSANPLNVVLPPGLFGKLQIKLVGLNGQLSKSFTQTIAPNQTELQLNLQGIAKGAYILNVANQSGEQFSVPVVVGE